MTDLKSFWQSRTVIAALVGFLAFAADGTLGFTLSEADRTALTDATLKIVQGISFIAALFFRLSATKRLV